MGRYAMSILLGISLLFNVLGVFVVLRLRDIIKKTSEASFSMGKVAAYADVISMLGAYLNDIGILPKLNGDDEGNGDSSNDS